ncbi:MAG: nucleotidyltransferase family protein [Candidatus Omnitrophica bacterium]|nr:nucleotidyltransferase family protein [Candidatus Omnitrophota bacterium]
MKALILAAGYATRLYPLTKHFPKPLLEVNKKPIINYIVDKLSRVEECDEIFVITNSKFFPKFKKWAKTVKSSKKIIVVNDMTRSLKDKRGAIGDMYYAIIKKKIKDDFLVVGGDNLFDEDLHGFMGFALSKYPHPSMGVFNIRDKRKACNYGVIKLDSCGKIIDFQEKPKHPASTNVAMCLYYFPAKKLELVGEYLSSRSNKNDATGFYIDWLRKKESVFGYVFNGKWFDIGKLEFYKKAENSFK